jgi:hypothetical protein
MSGGFQKIHCGKKVDSHRLLSPGVGCIMPMILDLKLLSVQKSQNPHLSKICISIKKHLYYSIDQANTFVAAEKETYCEQYPTRLSAPGMCVQSMADAKTIFRPGKNKSYYEISRNGGRSWKVIQPKLEGIRPLGDIRIIASSGNNASRVYATATESGEIGIYISEDFGETFKLLLRRSDFLYESQSNPSTLFSISEKGIIVSPDNGRKWNLMINTTEMMSPFYADLEGLSMQTWMDSKHKQRIDWSPNLIQIIADSNNKNAIYILTFKGLYRSLDGGDTFLLLPLADDKICEIQKIAVDPIDGRCLYAAVGKDGFYKSTDYGCSWRKIKLPFVADSGNPRPIW